MFLTAIFATILVLLDGYVTYRRIKKFGPFAELNPLVRQLIADFGLATGLLVGWLQNITILGLLVYFKCSYTLAFFTGVKFGLALMQLKSLQMENFVERILAKARERRKTP